MFVNFLKDLVTNRVVNNTLWLLVLVALVAVARCSLLLLDTSLDSQKTSILEINSIAICFMVLTTLSVSIHTACLLVFERKTKTNFLVMFLAFALFIASLCLYMGSM